jgi:DNA end-binding protein Ku
MEVHGLQFLRNMAHAIWRGALSFGLVNIPVNLHSAVRDNRPRFRLLHTIDKSPIKFQRVCVRDDQPVDWDDIVKGYEYEKGKFVVLTKEDFDVAALEKSRTIDIVNFVDADEVDDRFFETPYYLTPGKGGERAYALLREAIRESDKIGIAKIIIRETQHLAAVEAIDHLLVLTMMRFADEIAAASEFTVPDSKSIRPQELEMAKALVKTMASAWNPIEYKDEYRANIMRIIHAKLKGKKPKLIAEASGFQQAKVVDLMARLRRSLETGKLGRKKSPTHSSRKTKPSRKARQVA